MMVRISVVSECAGKQKKNNYMDKTEIRKDIFLLQAEELPPRNWACRQIGKSRSDG
jgi:hypothetical protein